MDQYGNNPPPYNEYPGNNQNYGYNMPNYPIPTSGMCIAGFVCSLALVGILGLIFSIIGIKECNDQGYNGKGLAIAGLVISIVKLALVIMWFSFFGCLCSSFMQYGLWR